MTKEYISSQQSMLLIAGFGVGTALLLLPTILVQFAKQGALISTALAMFPGILLVVLLSCLSKWYPGQSLVQYSVSVLGIPGRILGLLFIWFAFHLTTLVLSNIGDFVALIILPETPMPVVFSVLIGITALAIFYGLETTSRALSLLIFLATIFSVMLLLFTLPHGNFSNMMPIMGSGWGGIIKGGIYTSSFPVGEFVLFGMLIHNIKNPKGAALPLIYGQFIGATVGTAVFFQVMIILGPERASRSVMAIVSTLNALPGSNILLIPFALTWFIFAIVKLFICYYAFVISLAHWVRMEDYRPLVLPGGALIICIATILFSGVGEHQEFNRIYWPAYSIPLEYGIPLLIWLVAGIKKLFK